MTNEELVTEYQNGNDKAFDELLASNRGIIHFMKNKWWSIVSGNKSTEFELESEVTMGFFLAAKHYSDDGGRTFSSYAFHRIQWHLCRTYRLIQKTTSNGEPVEMCSLDAPVPGADDMRIEDTIADETDIENDSIEKLLKESEYPKLLEAVNSLNDKQRNVIIKRFYQNKSLDIVADDLSVTRERIRQVEQNALKVLAKMDSVKKIAQNFSYGCSAEYKGSLRRFKETGLSSVEYVVMKKIACEERMKQLNSDLLNILK